MTNIEAAKILVLIAGMAKEKPRGYEEAIAMACAALLNDKQMEPSKEDG